MDSLVQAQGLSGSVSRAILVPQPGIEPTSPALQGGFLAPGPPGQALQAFLTLEREG